ncbi:MAG TPA: hypothetical protein VFV05_15550 [Methylomirabilota bacterium]|nr:hypothetical protein [Methylomirabilota bacterium]
MVSRETGSGILILFVVVVGGWAAVSGVRYAWENPMFGARPVACDVASKALARKDYAAALRALGATDKDLVGENDSAFWQLVRIQAGQSDEPSGAKFDPAEFTGEPAK